MLCFTSRLTGHVDLNTLYVFFWYIKLSTNPGVDVNGAPVNNSM